MKAAFFGGTARPRRRLTRDDICAVQMQFQGLSVTLPDYGTIPWFGPFINSLPRAQRDAVRAVERATGTHCLRQLSYDYANDVGYSYPVPGADFTSDIAAFRARLEEDLDAGLIPVVELAGDGQRYSANGGTYGFNWLAANLKRILDGLGTTADACLFFHCWESVNYGGWSPDNLFTMTRLHRALRPSHCLAWHFSYAWPGDGAGSNLGPIGQWSGPGLDCDVMLAEGDAPFMQKDASGVWVPAPSGDPINGWQQRARCFLGARCNNALIYPGNLEPFYWTVPTPRGPRYAVAMELDMFRWTRGSVSVDEINAERAYLRQLGFSYIC